MTGRGGISPMHVHLPDVRRRGMHGVERGRALIPRAAGPRPDGRRQPRGLGEIAVRDGDVEARIVVRGRTEHVERLREPKTPGIVRRTGHDLEVAAVGLELIDALAEPHRLAVHLPVEAGVADEPQTRLSGPYIRFEGLRVGIADPPAGAQHLPDVSLAVAVGVLEKEEVRRRRDEDPAVGEGQARRDVQMVGEDRELVARPSPLVSSQILIRRSRRASIRCSDNRGLRSPTAVRARRTKTRSA